MPSDEEQTKSQTTDGATAKRVPSPAKPDQRHNRPEPKDPPEGLRVLYG